MQAGNLFRGKSFQWITSACVHMWVQVAFRVSFWLTLLCFLKHLQKHLYVPRCQMCIQHLNFNSK